MALPIIEAPKFELTVPSTGKKVEYRPYLVKEEKILRIAMESKDSKQILRAMGQVVESCTFNKLNARDLASFDLEYIFLQLRAQSVGANSEFLYPCTKCGEKNDVAVDLESIKVDGVSKKDKVVPLTDNIGVTLKYLTIKDVEELQDDEANTTEQSLKLIARSIKSIYDSEKIYPAFESTEEEMIAFIESLNSKQFDAIKEFVENTPGLKHKLEFQCSKCGHNNEVMLEGLQSFF